MQDEGGRMSGSRRTQTPGPELRKKIAAREAAARRQPEVVELSEKEMGRLYGRGPNRNRAFSGVLPWQRSLRDVNLNNGNLFKSFTDIQVAPARGAGLAFQRSYNSNDERVVFFWRVGCKTGAGLDTESFETAVVNYS
jgi:hypothetical protein